jgi:ABC-type transport system substrate-binding protein
MSTSLFTSLQGEEGIMAIDIPTNGFDLVRLRSDREPGNDPRVIQALKLATDRDAILELVQQGYGAVGRDSPIGPLYASYYSIAPLGRYMRPITQKIRPFLLEMSRQQKPYYLMQDMPRVFHLSFILRTPVVGKI